MDSGARPVVFLSCCSADQRWRDLLLPHLAGLELEVWDETRFVDPTGWYQDIEAALSRARFAICLVSPHFLASPFHRYEEVQYLLQMCWRGRLELVPLRVSPVAAAAFSWLRRIPVLPEHTTLEEMGDAAAKHLFADLALRIHDAVTGGLPPPSPGRVRSPERYDLHRLPETGSLLLGRQRSLLDWHDPHRNLTVLVARGGVGKSTLLRC